MDIVFLIIGVLVGLLAGYFFAKSKFQGSKNVQSEEFESLKTSLNSLTAEKGRADERSSMLTSSLDESKRNLDDERAKINELNSELSKVKTINSGLEEKLEKQKSDIAELQEKFISEFENLANKILEDKSKRFTDQNKENINSILDPLKQKIIDFEKKVNDVYINETRERASLAEQIKGLTVLNKQMTEDANNLTKALKGDSKTQGDWGEFILESMLEKAGLVRGREFFIQESFKSEDGAILRPDIIINLPDNKSVVIDSKVSLTAYEQYSSSDVIEVKKKAINEHVSSIRRHIKELSPKEYQNLYGLQSLDFILMFIPIEPAFYVALQNDSTLYSDALGKNILIISPSSLFPALKTIESMWRQERQNKNALDIAKKGGELYDKLVTFVDHLIKVGSKIKDSKTSYDDAMKVLAEGKGNIISKADTLKQMGAKTSKSIDSRVVDRAIDEEEQLKLINPEERID